MEKETFLTSPVAKGSTQILASPFMVTYSDNELSIIFAVGELAWPRFEIWILAFAVSPGSRIPGNPSPISSMVISPIEIMGALATILIV